MQDILTCVMGLDVHRDIIVACLVKGAVDAEPEAETRTFSTLIPEMQKLRDWVIEAECRNIAMESTGIYWQPIYEMLESCFDGEISILVVNARHMKNVPGRKTDMKDAQWIATLLRAGLLKGSFIPDKTFRELRHLTRYRKSVVHDITAQKNRIDKFLQSSGFRFTAFLSDTFGASGRNIIRHLIERGSIDREALDKCLKTKTRNRIDEILVALNGSLSVHQRRFLNIVFLHLEDLEAHKHTIEDEITEEVLKHTDALNLLCSIPGIDVTAAAAKEIVVGRYLFSGILFVSLSVLTFLLCIIAAFTGHFSFTTVVPNLVLGMCCTVLTICLGVPSGFVFKQSNCTGAMIAAIMFCAVIRSTGLDTAFFAASSFLAYTLLIIGMALLLYLSYRASLSIFRKRRYARSKVAPND